VPGTAQHVGRSEVDARCQIHCAPIFGGPESVREVLVGQLPWLMIAVVATRRESDTTPRTYLSPRMATGAATSWVRCVLDATFGDVSPNVSEREIGPSDAGAVALRPLTRTDYPTLARWRRDRAWLTWWGQALSEDELEDDYGPTIDGTEPTIMFIATEGTRDVGLVETYRHADHPTWQNQIQVEQAIGIDYGIGLPRDRGRGLGRAILTVLIEDALDLFPDCSCVVAVPKSANRPSCALLESLGFTLHAVKPVEGEWPKEGTSSIYRLSKDEWRN